MQIINQFKNIEPKEEDKGPKVTKEMVREICSKAIKAEDLEKLKR